MDFFQIKKSDAAENNYKLDLFNQVSNNAEVASMSSIKKYFNSLYDLDGSGFTAFSVGESIADSYVSENTNKIERLLGYRSMAMFHEIASALDMMCYSANVPDENNNIIDIKIEDEYLEAKDIDRIKQAIIDYLNLFDFENNFEEYFRILLTEGQICWENIVAKDELDAGIIGINIIPNEAFDFCYDIKTRKKMGIMITNTAADNFSLTQGFSYRGYTSTAIAPGTYSNLNCYEELLDNKCIVLPWEQLTYADSGVYSKDNRIVYPILERARRPLNQLKLIEDAILIYRVSRSPEKYVFNVDIGRMSAKAGQQKVAQLKKQFGTKKEYDPQTGSIGKTYDPMQMTENFWFVKGADSQGITVSPLTASHNFGNLDDLDYFRKNLLKSLHIPQNRFYNDNTALINKGDEGGITPEELDFAKFLMSQQKRLSQALLNGAIVHLKYTGLWDVYNLTKDKIKIVINPPIEYDTFRRQKLLEMKVNMLKTVLGDESATSLFSSDIALELFMGWDKAKIQANKEMRFREELEEAKLAFYKKKIEENGAIDVKDESGNPTFKEILQQGLDDSFLEGESGGESSEEGEGGEEGSSEEFNDEGTGEEFADVEATVPEESGDEEQPPEGGE